jgi:hypothetical protein
MIAHVCHTIFGRLAMKLPLAKWLQAAVDRQAAYDFKDHWRVAGSIAEVAELLLRPEHVAEWWPHFLGVELRESGQADGLGRLFSSRIKGFLPYTLNLQFFVDAVQFPEAFAVRIEGDFLGVGGGRLTQIGDQVQIEFEMNIEIRRPPLRWLSLFLRPLMSLQHRVTMLAGEAALRRRLQAGWSTTMAENRA